MIRLFKLASYALMGYAMYELVVGISEGREEAADNQKRQTPQQQQARQPLKSNEPGRGVISS